MSHTFKVFLFLILHYYECDKLKILVLNVLNLKNLDALILHLGI